MKKSALLALAAMLVAAPAYAQFEIEGATTASQEVEMELQNTLRVGGIAAGDPVSEHSVGVYYGALRSWRIGASFDLVNRRGEQIDLESFTMLSTVAILGGETSSQPEVLDLAFVSEFNFGVGDQSQRDLAIGPAIGLNFDPLSILTNTFFIVPLSDGSDNVGVEYALGAMYAVSDSLEVGFEAHGEVPNAFNETPAIKRQEHFAGPAVAFTFEPEPDREVGVRLGSFFGLTPASPTVGVSANLELGF